MPGGRPKGSLNIETLDKLDAREAVRKLIMADIEPIIHALKAKAKGTPFLVYRDADGKFMRIAEADARKLKGKQLERLEVWEKQPDVAAAQELLDRALDKPKQQPHEIKLTTDSELLEKLDKAKRRNREQIEKK